METSLVNATLQSVWSKWSAQLAAFQLKTPANLTITGTVVKVQTHLVIQPVSFWLIEAGLLILIALVVVLAALTPKDVLPRDPASLGGLATMLASSQTFKEERHNHCG